MKVNFIKSFVLLAILLVVPVALLLSSSKSDRSTSYSWRIICQDYGSLDSLVFDVEPYYFGNDTKVIVNNCPPPLTSYAKILASIGFNVTSIELLILLNIRASNEAPLTEDHFTGLSIKKLSLHFDNNVKDAHLEQEFLRPLPNLSELVVSGARIKPIPPHIKLVEARFAAGIFLDKFGACNELQSLFLSQWEVLKEDFLEHCPKLTTLRLSDMLSRNVVRVIKYTKFVTHLRINNCALFSLRSIPFDHMALTSLQLNNNFLQDLKLITFMPHLREIYLNNNAIEARYPEIIKLFKNLPQLRVLEVSNNVLFNFCMNKNTTSFEILHPLLERLVFVRTYTELFCLDAGVFPSLQYLDLREQRILVLQFQGLQVSNVALDVNLQQNFITGVKFTQSDYNSLAQRINPPISLNGKIELNCDCLNAWFATALRHNLIIAPKIRCKGYAEKTHITHIPADQLECYKFPCSGCTCRQFWRSNYTEATCTDEKVTKIPNVTGLNSLLAPFNNIILRKNEIPDSLMYLDLRSNEILHIDEEVTKQLFSKNREICLSGNPFLCDCKNFAFIEAVQKFSKQVLDYNYVRCAGNGTVFNDIILNDLCRAKEVIQAAIATGGAVLAIAAITAVVYFQYGSTIHMFLYARGWLCCINEDKLDANRSYDAFVSFCHMDAPVAYEILAWLEERGFKVCVHYRDWMPGEMIPTQIVRSVELSRRTVILLSKHFPDSTWGLLEFRTAHTRALKEGVMRVILVVLDDVVDSNDLDDDLRRYIRLNTYVRYDDPWFWEKLLYAMPKRRTQPTSSGSATLDNIGLQIMPALVNEPFIQEPVLSPAEPVVSSQSRSNSLEDVASEAQPSEILSESGQSPSEFSALS